MAKESNDILMAYTPVALQMYDVLAEDIEAVREDAMDNPLLLNSLISVDGTKRQSVLSNTHFFVKCGVQVVISYHPISPQHREHMGKVPPISTSVFRNLT